MTTTSAREWAESLSASDCELIVHNALKQGDVKAVVYAMRLLASKDPRRAQQLFDVIQLAIDLAKSGPDGRAGVEAELRAIFGTADGRHQCVRCSRSGGELTENGCPTCGPDTEVRFVSAG